MQAVLRTSVAGMQIQIPVQLPAPALARLDANGTITIPKDAIAFTTGASPSVPIPGSEIERMDVVATTDFIGTIDDEAGTMTLRGEVAGVLSGGGLDSCGSDRHSCRSEPQTARDSHTTRAPGTRRSPAIPRSRSPRSRLTRPD